ncbi:mediator of RNA polymerase II transcription subunit 1-domain-containing protein [Limtongia smithiae]|uniref:mediator of RNA polymerase II transcription subunit 1-domain-containing protein n=1 Tax=Limtongia smithiae TaxID=1125753 RepID=UPI0034CDA42C
MTDSPLHFKIPSSSEVSPLATPDNNLLLGISPDPAAFSPASFSHPLHTNGIFSGQSRAATATPTITFSGPPSAATPSTPSALRNIFNVGSSASPSIGVNGAVDGILDIDATPRRPVFGRTKSEAARKRDIDEIVDLLRRRPGALSELAIERLARSNGLEVFHEDIDGGKRISLGGRIILIDIDLMIPSNKVIKAKLSLASMITGGDSKALAQSDAILLADLQFPTLDKFARNLERVARHDKLSSTETDNFQVLESLHRTVLQRIYAYETSVRNIDALNDGHGMPKVDDAGVLGLSIWYWREKHRIPSSAPLSSDNAYRVIVEIDESGHSGNGWGIVQNNPFIGDSIATSSGDIDWQEPDYSNLEDQPTSYVLILDPPVSIPYYDAAILDPEGEAELETISTFTNTTEKLLTAKRTVYDSTGTPVDYDFTLMMTQTMEMRKFERVYIAHPRQIIKVLEILRQAIRVRALLDSAFAEPLQAAAVASKVAASESHHDLNSFLAAVSAGATIAALRPPAVVTIKLSMPYGQPPLLGVMLPTTDYSASDMQPRLTSFSVEVNRGGAVSLRDLAVNENMEFEGKQQLMTALENVIDVAEDLGIVAHWLSEQVQ